jgi:hypothetical protein
MANFWDNDTPDTATLPEPPPQDFWKNDIPEAPAAPVEDYWQNDTPKDKPFFNLSDTASALADLGRGIVVSTPAAARTLWEGLDRPDKWSPETRAAIEADEAFQREMAAKTEQNRAAGTSSSVGETFRELGSSVGFSLVGMGAAIPATVAGGYLTRSKLGANLAGGLAGGTAAYRMAGARFLNDSFKDWQTQEEKRLGRPVTETEKEAAYQELLPLAQNAGLWEAGPEAIGNMATLGAGKVILGLGKNRITDLAKGSLAKIGIKAGAAAGAIGTELATETATQVGQGLPQAQAEAIAAGQDPALAQSAYPVSVEGFTQAFKDVAPQTLALSGLMMGAAGGVRLATKPFRNQPAAVPPPLPTNTPPTPGTPPSAITPLVNIARQAGAQDRVRLTPEEAAAGLADPGTLEGDLLSDARFRPPAGAVAPTLQPLPNVADQSGLTDLGTVEGDVLERVPQPAADSVVNESLTPEDEAQTAQADAVIAQQNIPRDSADVKINAPKAEQLGKVVFQRPDGSRYALLDNSKTPPEWQTAAGRTASLEGFGTGTSGRGFRIIPIENTNFTIAEASPETPAGDSLYVLTEEGTGRSIGVVSATELFQTGWVLSSPQAQPQQAQARNIRPPTPGTVSRQGSALPFEEIVAMAAAALRNGVTNFSAWATAMVRRFGEGVRRFLSEAWQSAVKNSQVGARANLNPNAPRTPQDTEYLAAVDAGDLETAQRMVNEAAQRAGYDVEGFHGTNSPEFKEFTDSPMFGSAWFFSDGKEYPAQRGSRVMAVRLKPGKQKIVKIPTNKPWSVPSYEKDILDAARSQGFDSVKLEAVPPLWMRAILPMIGLKAEVSGYTNATVVFNPNQIKSADPVTRDDQGNVIPLSRRFNPKTDSILYMDATGLLLASRVITTMVRDIRDFTAFSRNALKRFGEWIKPHLRAVWKAGKQSAEAVHNYLKEAWEAATAAANRASKAPLQFGQRPLERRARAEEAGFLHPGDLPKAITTRLGLQQNAPFRVKQLGARDLFLGSTLPTNMVPLVARSENEVKAVEQTAAQLARDLQTAETAAVNRRGLPLDRLHGHVTDFLNGVPVAGAILSAMDPVTYDRARRMRNFIDDLTATVAASLPAGTMRDTLVNNTGSWLRRSYAAFDPNSGWNFENVMTAARKGKDVGGRPALDILRKGAAYLSAQNGYPASMRTAQGLPVAGSELESDMRNLMDRDQYERALSGQPGASKNVTSLMRRKDIPPEIRELMGEETNVYKRFTASASFQAQFIRRHHAQVAMRQVGLASGLFSMNRGGVFTQQIPADGPRWSGLEGVWTTPELWEALQLSTGVAAAGTDIAGYVGRFLRYTSSKAKLNRVAMNPDSWMVNGLGGAAMMLMNGDWFSGRVAARLMESVRLMKSGRAKSGDVVNAAQDALKDIQRDLIARLTAEGVFGAGVSVADIEASLPRHTLQWIETDLMRDRAAGAVEGAIIGQGMGRGFGPDVRVYGGIIGGALGGIAGAKRIRTAQNAIADLALTKPDMLFRLTGFLTNYEAALGAGLAPDAAFNEASTRTLNTFPNYAAVPAFLRSLSQFGAINSFVSFMFEMHRNTAWSMRYMAQDLAAPSMAQKRRGLQRLAGAGAVGALMAGGLPALISLLFGGGDDKDKVGMDDERNNIFTRWFAAPWERDAILAFTKFDKEGVSYLNTSYLLPQQILGELAMAARNGDNPTDAAARIAVRLQTQFAGDSVNLTPLMQAYTNTDGRGRPVTVRSGIEGAWERTDHALKVIAEPGFVEKVNKLIYAYRDAERRGRTFSVEQEFRRVIGLRETTRTWSDLTLGRYKEFDSQIGRIREGANRTLGENLPGAKATALERANRELAEIRTEMQRFEKEAVKLGVPFGILQRAKKDVGLSNIRNVMVDPIKRNRVKSIGTR